VPEVVHRAVVFGTYFLIGDVDAEKNLYVVFKVGSGSWPSPPEFRINIRCFSNVVHDFYPTK